MTSVTYDERISDMARKIQSKRVFNVIRASVILIALGLITFAGKEYLAYDHALSISEKQYTDCLAQQQMRRTYTLSTDNTYLPDGATQVGSSYSSQTQGFVPLSELRTYVITDPNGRVIEVHSKRQPTEDEMNKVFALPENSLELKTKSAAEQSCALKKEDIYATEHMQNAKAASITTIVLLTGFFGLVALFNYIAPQAKSEIH